MIPLAIPTTSLAIGFRLGLIALLVHCALALLVRISPRPTAEAELAGVLLIIAGLVTTVQLLCKAFLFDFYVRAGAFLPLIIANGTLLACADRPDVPAPLATEGLRALRQGSEYVLLLCAVGGLRELVGAEFTLALVPGGAFLVLALLAVARAAIPAR
jgi:electron transport complex protein RnfE